MPTILSHRELAEWVDPAEAFAAALAAEPHAFWLDAGPGAESGWSWIGTGTPTGGPPRDVACAPTPGDDAAQETGGAFRGGWVGWSGYDPAASIAGAPASEDAAVPAERGLHVDRFVAFDHATRRRWAWAPAGEADDFADLAAGWRGAARTPAPSSPVTVTARDTPEEYAALIARCRASIREGDAYQLCLTTRFSVAGDIDPFETYLRLREATPAHHGGFLRVGDHALASASPERFLEVSDGIVRTHPIKGTRPRADDHDADAALASDLRASVKERAENVMIVDLMRNDLQRVCLPGTVAAERLLEVESYAAVHQLVSSVAGRLRPGIRWGDLLEAAFPAGSMTGAPKLSAMTILHELERGPRGVYAGCFGWVGADGRGDLAMVIRSIVFHPGGAYVGAGGGITWRSDVAEEVAEVGIKAHGPLRAVGGTLPSGW